MEIKCSLHLHKTGGDILFNLDFDCFSFVVQPFVYFLAVCDLRSRSLSPRLPLVQNMTLGEDECDICHRDGEEKKRG